MTEHNIMNLNPYVKHCCYKTCGILFFLWPTPKNCGFLNFRLSEWPKLRLSNLWTMGSPWRINLWLTSSCSSTASSTVLMLLLPGALGSPSLIQLQLPVLTHGDGTGQGSTAQWEPGAHTQGAWWEKKAPAEQVGPSSFNIGQPCTILIFNSMSFFLHPGSLFRKRECRKSLESPCST